MRTVRLAGVVAGGVAVAAAAYVAFWFVAADVLRSRVTEWVRQESVFGWRLKSDGMEIGGFPMRFTVTLHNPVIGAARGAWNWQGERLIAELRPWNFRALTLALGGRSSILVKDGEQWREIAIEVDEGDAMLSLADSQRISAVTLDIVGVRIEGLIPGGPVLAERLRAQCLLPPLHGHGATAARASSEVTKVMFNLETLQMPPDVAEGLGSTIEFLNLDAELEESISGEGGDNIAVVWRDPRSGMELNSLNLRWGPLGLTARGYMALDRELKPIGALTADIVGYGDVVDALILSDLIPLGDGFLVKVAFNVMAEKPADGGPPALRNVPLTARDGELLVGSVAFAKLPSLDFPQ